MKDWYCKMIDVDVLIVGGGIIGCSAARELSKFNLNVVLMEKETDICSGQSKANTAIIHGGYDAKPGTLKARYNVRGNRMFGRLCKELDVPLRWNTSLVLAFSEKDVPQLEALRQQGIRNGVTGLSIIGRDEINRREPHVSKKTVAALLSKQSGILSPFKFTIANAENAAENGVVFHRNAEVFGIKREESKWIVKSTIGTFRAKAVLNCAGVYTDTFNNQVSAVRYEILPRRGQYYLLDKKYAKQFHASIFQLPTHMGKGTVISPTVDGTVLVGPTAEDIMNRDDTRTTVEGLKKVFSSGKKIWEELPLQDAIKSFAGVRAHCNQNDFILGEAPDAPFFFNALGVESPGLTAAPAIALDLARQVSERLHATCKMDFQPFHHSIPTFEGMREKQKRRICTEHPGDEVIVCQCEGVTRWEIREAIRRPVGARTIDGIKRRVRAGMGSCQARLCAIQINEILEEELTSTFAHTALKFK
ncbi:MAG TPA: FAD/NAD(P)-binding oxidoreductase [Ruminococcaceae bacterium]|nr:FAD/NAD(P)-binding oxidoreductase [Oscillospiraceae bacterium]